MSGKVKSSHYSSVEKKLFLEILKLYSHVIENKKSDAATLSEKSEAWKAINENYNSSTIISEKRDVGQLKKLWSNMKTQQRNALTREKQQRLATGGGPPIQDVEIDPDITLIAPNLIKTAPTLFSSNMNEGEIAAKRDVVNMLECEDYSQIETLFDDDDDLMFEPQTFEDSTKASTSGINAKKRPYDDGLMMNDVTKKLKNPSIKTSMLFGREIKSPFEEITASKSRKKKSTNENDEEKNYRAERLRKIIEQEEQLFNQKIKNDNEIHNLTKDYLTQKYKLEIRAAKASAELAEFNLLKAKNKDCEHDC